MNSSISVKPELANQDQQFNYIDPKVNDFNMFTNFINPEYLEPFDYNEDGNSENLVSHSMIEPSGFIGNEIAFMNNEAFYPAPVIADQTAYPFNFNKIEIIPTNTLTPVPEDTVQPENGTPRSEISKISEQTKYAIEQEELSKEDKDLLSNGNPKERRQVRNKISARHFRLRKKEYINDLETIAKNYEKDTDTLKNKVYSVELENAYLKMEVEDLRNKFEFITLKVPSMNQFAGLDPVSQVAINSDGELTKHIPTTEVKDTMLFSQQNFVTCRESAKLSSTPTGKDQHLVGNHKGTFQRGNVSPLIKA